MEHKVILQKALLITAQVESEDESTVARDAMQALTDLNRGFFGGLQSGSTGEPVNLLNDKCDELLTTGALEKQPDSQGRHCWGTGVKRAVFFQGKDYAPVDLFQVIGPAQWGVLYAIRTGPGDFNHLLVTNRRFGGACPPDRKVAGVSDYSEMSRVWWVTPSPTITRAALCFAILAMLLLG